MSIFLWLCFQITTTLAQWVPVALLLAAGMYSLFFSCSQNLFLADLLPDNLATQSTEASSLSVPREVFPGALKDAKITEELFTKVNTHCTSMPTSF